VSRLASRDPAIVQLTARLSRSDLLWVANTAHGPGGHWHARVRAGEPDHDHLASPDAALGYLADHGVPVPPEPPDPIPLSELGIVRVMVSRLLVPDADPWTDAGRTLLASTSYAVDPATRIADTQPGWRGFCRDLLLPLLALVPLVPVEPLVPLVPDVPELFVMTVVTVFDVVTTAPSASVLVCVTT